MQMKESHAGLEQNDGHFHLFWGVNYTFYTFSVSYCAQYTRKKKLMLALILH